MDEKPPLIGLLILLLGAVYFAITETALSSVSKNKIKVAFEHKNPFAKYAQFALNNFDKAITTILIGTNIVHISVAGIVTVYVTINYGISAVSISTLITTFIVFFFGEMLPKTLGKKYSFKITLFSSPLLVLLMKVFTPFSFFLTWLGNIFKKESEDVSVTEDELQEIIEDMAEEGALNEQQEDLISSALEFGDVTAESILTPRVDMVAINVNDSTDDILSFMKNQTHSRIPVYENTIDNIIGVLGFRKYMRAYLKTGKAPDIRPLLNKVHFAHMSTEVHKLLPALSRNKLNMAVITDNYGGTLGIVTVEDILEALVGDIWDESDEVTVSIKKISEKVFLVRADMILSDVFDQIGFEDPNEEDKDLTNMLLGEWVYEHFNQIPLKGQYFDYYGLRVIVEKISHHRILTLRIIILDNMENEKK